MTEASIPSEPDTRCRAIHSVKGTCDCLKFVLGPNRKDGMRLCITELESGVCGHSEQVHKKIEYGKKR